MGLRVEGAALWSGEGVSIQAHRIKVCADGTDGRTTRDPGRASHGPPRWHRGKPTYKSAGEVEGDGRRSRTTGYLTGGESRCAERQPGGRSLKSVGKVVGQTAGRERKADGAVSMRPPQTVEARPRRLNGWRQSHRY